MTGIGKVVEGAGIQREEVILVLRPGPTNELVEGAKSPPGRKVVVERDLHV
jgi:hypothetical protein